MPQSKSSYSIPACHRGISDRAVAMAIHFKVHTNSPTIVQRLSGLGPGLTASCCKECPNKFISVPGPGANCNGQARHVWWGS
ncbi:hypothetical protein LIA77_07213 [Sarocladium implicatum]|nr:hypothetical protein LIA77_07213 [Sarocladium implicatum]